MVADSEKALATAEYWDKRYTNPEASEVERSWYRTFEQVRHSRICQCPSYFEKKIDARYGMFNRL